MATRPAGMGHSKRRRGLFSAGLMCLPSLLRDRPALPLWEPGGCTRVSAVYHRCHAEGLPERLCQVRAALPPCYLCRRPHWAPERSSSGSTASPERASPAAGQVAASLPQQLAEGLALIDLSKDLLLTGALPIFLKLPCHFNPKDGAVGSVIFRQELESLQENSRVRR